MDYRLSEIEDPQRYWTKAEFEICDLAKQLHRSRLKKIFRKQYIDEFVIPIHYSYQQVRDCYPRDSDLTLGRCNFPYTIRKKGKIGMCATHVTGGYFCGRRPHQRFALDGCLPIFARPRSTTLRDLEKSTEVLDGLERCAYTDPLTHVECDKKGRFGVDWGREIFCRKHCKISARTTHKLVEDDHPLALFAKEMCQIRKRLKVILADLQRSRESRGGKSSLERSQLRQEFLRLSDQVNTLSERLTVGMPIETLEIANILESLEREP